MSTSTVISDQAAGFDCARKALAELRRSPINLRGFVFGLFDELDVFAHKLLDREILLRQVELHDERQALQERLDHLTVLMDELTKTVADQKQIPGHWNG